MNKQTRTRSGGLSRRGVATLALAGLPALGGCALFRGLRKPPPKYSLMPATEFLPNLPRVNWQLEVRPVASVLALDTVLVALRRKSQYRIDYIKNMTWSERAPRMIQMLAVETLENSGLIKAVGHEDSGFNADIMVQLDMRSFTADITEDDRRFVELSIAGRLIEMERVGVIAQRTFGGRQPYVGKKAEPVLDAFQAVTTNFLKELVAWIAVTASTYRKIDPIDEFAAPPPEPTPAPAGPPASAP